MKQVKSTFYTNIDRYRNTIKVRGYDSDGNRYYESFKYRPTAFLPVKDPKDATWEGLDGTKLKPVQFDSMSAHRKFISEYESTPGYCAYGSTRHIHAFINDEFPQNIEYDPRMIDIGYFDIETESGGGFPVPSIAAQKILTIAYKSSKCDTYILWGLLDYDQSKVPDVDHLKIEYRQFDTETELLMDFLEFWSEPESTPDIICGWNSEFFDIPYLVNRIVKVLGVDYARKLSPYGELQEKKVTRFGNEEVTYKIAGIQHIDYMAAFKKFTVLTYGPQESYKLDFIGEVVLGKKKLDHSHIGDGSLHDLYRLDYDTFCSYNCIDVELLVEMEKKLGMMNLIQTMAYLAGACYTDTLGTTALWESLIHRRLYKKKVAVPHAKYKDNEGFEGAYVKEVQPGIHDWVMSFDLNSLYPNIIIQWNMSPETLLPEKFVPGAQIDALLDGSFEFPQRRNVAYAANGSAFSTKTQGHIPQIVENIYADRKQTKAKMIKLEQDREKLKEQGADATTLKRIDTEISLLDTKQLALKLNLNSLYGAMGNQYFLYFDIRIAEAITLTGQYINRSAENVTNSWIQSVMKDKEDRVIAMDTDSIYVRMSSFIEKFNPKDPVKFLDRIGEDKIIPAINAEFQTIHDKLGCFKPRMVEAREVIASRAVWTTKKRYIMRVLNSEGVQYAKPKIKIMGIEGIKSSTPKPCREAMIDIYKLILEEDEKSVQDYVKQFEARFRTMEPHEIGLPRGVTGVEEYRDDNSKTLCKSRTPINSRASLVFNKLLRDMGLDKTIEPIKGGDKIKFVFLRLPNPTKQNVIAFKETLPKQMDGIKSYIDFNKQFEKTFEQPMNIIMKAVGWNLKPTADLSSFF